MNEDIQITNEELIEENESLLADRKELISQIEALKLEKENLVSVIFSMEILIMYGEQSKPADFRSIWVLEIIMDIEALLLVLIGFFFGTVLSTYLMLVS